jgi:tetratricopeptide (TPR) repeat protein
MMALRCAIVFLGLSSASSLAGVYNPAEPFLFTFDDKGGINALAYADFRFLLTDTLTILSPSGAKRKQEVEARITQLRTQPPERLNAEEFAELTALLFRLNRTDEALNFLQQASRDRRRASFLTQTHLAHGHALRGEYREAFEFQFSALRDYPPLPAFTKRTKPELAWQRGVEEQYLLPWLRLRRDESTRKSERLHDAPDAIFPYRDLRTKQNREPIAWRLPPAEVKIGYFRKEERLKLPADALAIAQQLLFWNPADPRLFWLLGCVYYAEGEFETALKIFDDCVDAPRNYSVPALMEFRQALRECVAQRRLAEEAAEEEKKSAEKAEEARAVRYLSWGAGVVLTLFFLVAFRQFLKRLRKR